MLKRALFHIFIFCKMFEEFCSKGVNKGTHLILVLSVFTLGSSGGSNCTIQSTSGMSSPRAATSVHNKMASLALQNWKKVWVRLACFCLPWWRRNNRTYKSEDNSISNASSYICNFDRHLPSQVKTCQLVNLIIHRVHWSKNKHA